MLLKTINMILTCFHHTSKYFIFYICGQKHVHIWRDFRKRVPLTVEEESVGMKKINLFNDTLKQKMSRSWGRAATLLRPKRKGEGTGLTTLPAHRQKKKNKMDHTSGQRQIDEKNNPGQGGKKTSEEQYNLLLSTILATNFTTASSFVF